MARHAAATWRWARGSLLTLITLFPIYWMFVVSGKSRVELFGRPSFLIKSFFTENYTNVLATRPSSGYMINSMIVATSNAVLVTTLALLATYALSRFALAGQDNIFFWTITNRMAPPAVFLLPLFLLFTQVFVIGDWSLFDTRTRADPALLRVQPAVRDLAPEGHDRRHPGGARRGGDAGRRRHLARS